MTGGARFTDALGQRLIVCDGAMGTMLHAAGCALDRALPEVNLSDPKLVAAIHESYISAGADVIQTNTFGANRLWLAGHGYPDQVEEINRAAVGIAREMSERSDREVFVAGSVSPAVTARQRRQVGAAERQDVIAEQIRSLAARGQPDHPGDVRLPGRARRGGDRGQRRLRSSHRRAGDLRRRRAHPGRRDAPRGCHRAR